MMRGARFEVRFVLRVVYSVVLFILRKYSKVLRLLVSEKFSIGFICFKSSAVLFKVLIIPP